MKFGANLNTLYTELPWNERFAAAKADGFDAVEFWDWRTIDKERTAGIAQKAGISISGFNGDNDYSLIDPTHKKPYLEYLKRSMNAAKVLNAPSVTIHSNALGDGGVVVNSYDYVSDTVKLCSMFGTLKEAVALAEQSGICLNMEGLNIYTDHKGNFLQHTQMSAEICRMIASPYLKILYDIYHMQINEGRLCDTLSEYIDCIGHVHIADVPGRHEPGTGEINYSFVLKHLQKLGYSGIIGCELFPKTDTETAVKAIMAIKTEVEADRM